MTSNLRRAAASALLALATAAAFAQSGTQGGGPGDGAGNGSIGDFRYASVPPALKCATPSGVAAACAEVSGAADAGIGAADDAVDPRPGPQRGQTQRGGICGDGVCDANESGQTCSADCGGTPSGIGARIGEGFCVPQATPLVFPVKPRGTTSSQGYTCEVLGRLGANAQNQAVPFGQVIVVDWARQAPAGGAPYLVIKKNGQIQNTGANGKNPTLSGRGEFLCANGVFLPRAVECDYCNGNACSPTSGQ